VGYLFGESGIGTTSKTSKTSHAFLLQKYNTMNNNHLPIGDLILQKLKEEKRSVAWLADKICIDPSSLRKRLKKIP
jgi:hypothetical protein